MIQFKTNQEIEKNELSKQNELKHILLENNKPSNSLEKQAIACPALPLCGLAIT